MAQIAAGLGFEFFPTGDSVYLARLAGLELFSRGRQKKLWNLLRGTSHSFEVNIFDYSYVTGSGRRSRTWRQTIICLQSPALRLPDFMLSPKSFWNMIGAIFGHTEIEIEGHPVFSKMYVLRGSDPEAIRRTFTDNVLVSSTIIWGYSAKARTTACCSTELQSAPSRTKSPACWKTA